MRKAENEKKHNVNFFVASSVFLDNDALIDFDRQDNEEERFDIIGMAVLWCLLNG